jgi:iron complex outermembrane recepter protein
MVEHNRNSTIRTAVVAALAAATGVPLTGFAADAENRLEEIIVTARKRDESVLRTPVTIDVVSAETMKDLKIDDLYDLQEVAAPGLKVSNGFGPVGTVVYMRGIGSGDTASYVDQSVGLNIDGVSYSHGVFYKSGTFDLAQLEVLKGPQGLFFGKSTTAGIIALHTANPTPEWDSEISASYEFEGDETDVRAYVSGPINDNFGIRLAGYYNRAEGWLYNPNPDPRVVHRLPDGEDYGGRLTLAWDAPDAGFSANLKVGATTADTRGNSGTLNQGFNCPIGVRQTPEVQPFDNCKLDKYTQGYGSSPPYDPNVDWYTILPGDPAWATGTAWPAMKDGKPYGETDTFNANLQLDWEFSEGLTLTSLTGYGHVETTDTVHSAFYFAPAAMDAGFDISGEFKVDEFSQELRLTSNWTDSWFNFMVGALYAPSETDNEEFASVPLFGFWSTEVVHEQNDTTSAFAQLLLTPWDKWEIAPGVRYTKVHRFFDDLSVYNNLQIPGNNGTNFAPDIPRDLKDVDEDNVSPELTVSYLPNEDLTIYASYKQGYKGPGFNNQTFLLASYNPAIVPNAVGGFSGEEVEGVEGGIKARLFDSTLDLSFTPYYYKYDKLQVSNLNYVTNVIEVQNGADARTQGFEVTAAWQLAEGLRLNALVAYNDAEFTSFPASPCYGGQTAAQGCVTDASGNQTQDLKGQTPYQAPEWAGTLGVTYERSVGDWLLGITGNASASSSYFTVAKLTPSSEENGWWTFDAAVRLETPNRKWAVALIGRNLSNELYAIGASDSGTITPGVVADSWGFTNRSRQVALQLTWRP